MSLETPGQTARRFLDIVADIEQLLRNRYPDVDTEPGLGALVRVLRTRDAGVNRYSPDLRIIADLRNAIAHHAYHDDTPIAVPLASTVELAQRILGALKNPPTVEAVMARSPMTAQRHDDLREHLIAMETHSFSQLPVYDAARYVGLLTTNAVARWVASELNEVGEAIVEGVTVADVLKHCEQGERAVFLGRRITLAAAFEKLAAANGPVALLITENGKAEESLLGMLVASDIARMAALLDLRT